MPDLKMILDRYFYAMLLVLIVGGMGFIKPETFLTWSNISVVVFQQAPLTILMSFGMTLAIIAKGIDVSMGSVLVLSSVLSAGFIKSDDIMLGICIALMTGAFFGFLNGVLITGVGIDPFIATYGMSSVALGLAYVYTGGIYIYDFPPRFREISNGSMLGGIPNLAFVVLLVFAVLHFVTKKTTFGHGIFSAGCNINATILSGINARAIVTIVYMINGFLAAVTGILYMARLNAADPGISASFTLDAIAATLIGGTSFEGGKGSVANTLIGATIIVFIRNGMNIMGVSMNWQQTVIGFIIILSIIIQAAFQKFTVLQAGWAALPFRRRPTGPGTDRFRGVQLRGESK